MGFLLEAELAAGCVDVAALFEAEGGGDAGVLEDIAEGAAMGVGRALPREASVIFWVFLEFQNSSASTSSAIGHF